MRYLPLLGVVALLTCEAAPAPAPVPPQIEGLLVRSDVLPEQLQIWLDFDGGTLVYQQSCAKLPWNGTCYEDAAGPYAAFYGTRSTRDSIEEEMTRIFAPYNVRVTQDRPLLGGAVVHVVFSNWSAYAAKHFDYKIRGFARVDCANYNPTGIAFVLDVGEVGSISYAATAAHEVGHAIGFDHASAAINVMSRQSSDGTLFLNACVALDPQEDGCTDDDRAWYGCANGQRNYHMELMALTWPSTRDTGVK